MPLPSVAVAMAAVVVVAMADGVAGWDIRGTDGVNSTTQAPLYGQQPRAARILSGNAVMLCRCRFVL
ncbi:hypothetical protein E2C01_090082 [Portunus trituberculatus]|uniref:Uncharacterized protein n=1 Tax=Portunus trituberculatus TaxID=210409 RepID=A0A5B7JF98_PORTR|nr:hypothetical protein [Portunus trituberculatus]